MSAAGISVGSIKSPLVPVTSITEDGNFASIRARKANILLEFSLSFFPTRKMWCSYAMKIFRYCRESQRNPLMKQTENMLTNTNNLL